MDTSSRCRPLRSQTVDTLFHILSLCYADSSHVIQNSDKGTEGVPSDCNDTIPTDLLFQEQMPTDETRVVCDTQESGLCHKHIELAQHDHNLSGEKKDLLQKVDINPSVNLDIQSQDDYDIITSSPHLSADKAVKGLEILEDLMDLMPETNTKPVEKTNSEAKDLMNTKAGLQDNNDSTLLCKETVKNGGKDTAGVVNKTRRNLVSYSEIEFESERVPVLQSNSKVNATKNLDRVYPLKNRNAPNNKKRPNSGTKDKRTNKKSKKPVDSSTCFQNPASHGEQQAVASQEVVSTSENNVASVEKKRKRGGTKEMKKMKKRMKRAEENRKLGIKRLKLQPVVKEKKIIYCRHYMNGRCHEGEKCKFSHDTTPLTKSKPCVHFARHVCMKGDSCPYDHELSKYPCINYQTKGSCNRGSACMFSHEGQPSEAPVNASNEKKPEHKPPSNTRFQKAETKSCLVPKVIDITPKSARPPKGISFLSQEKLPLESPQAQKIIKTPPAVQDSKEITKTPLVVQDSKEITKTPPAIPRGINFLSFGKRPGLDCSNGGFSFKINNRTEKPQLSGVEGEGLKSNSMVNEVKVDFSTDVSNTFKKPMHVMPFMSSTSQKALHSTLAFASKFDFGVKSKV